MEQVENPTERRFHRDIKTKLNFWYNSKSVANKNNIELRTVVNSCFLFCTLMEATSNVFLKNELYSPWVSNDI